MSARARNPERLPGAGWETRLESRHRVFVAAAMCTATATGFLFPEPTRTTQLVALSIGVVLLALPHGAVDPWLAIRPSASRSTRLRFVVHYLVLAALALACWIAAPTIFLVVFLGVSAWHFGQGEVDARRPTILGRSIECATAGATPILAPILLRPEETLDLLGLLCSRDLSRLPSTTVWSASIAAWIGCRISSWLDRLRFAWRNRDGVSVAIAAGQIGCVTSFLALPVLLAFGLYFCLDHSIRHALRVAARFAPTSQRQGLRKYATRAMPATLATVGLAIAVGAQESGGFGEAELAKLVFVGLAALTLPHVTIGLPIRPLDATG